MTGSVQATISNTLRLGNASSSQGFNASTRVLGLSSGGAEANLVYHRQNSVDNNTEDGKSVLHNSPTSSIKSTDVAIDGIRPRSLIFVR